MTTSLRPAYHAPQRLADALALIADPSTTSVVLGGGTVIYPRLCDDSLRPTRMVDIGCLPALAGIAAGADDISIGPALTYSALLAAAEAPELLRRIALGITGGPQIRNQATLGGSACHANPGSDIPTGLVALDARLTLASERRGERVLRASEFFSGAFETTRKPDELLVEIVVPRDAAGERWGYCKFKTAESSWPIAVAAARVCDRADGASLSLTIGAATAIPVALPEIPLADRTRISPSEQALVRAAVRTAPALWWEDEFGDVRYRRRIAEAIAVRAVEDALTQE